MGTESTESRDAIRAQLRKIVGSRLFRSSELAKKFLRFVVNKTLDNQTDAIKEYSVGVEAFGRGPDFDPRVDSVVRVVARRVRDKLAEYYRHEGKSDSLLIEVPTGSYVPSFSVREAVDPAVPRPASPTPDSSPQDSGDLVGRTVIHYEILEQIGRGGSGLVYRAEDLRLNRGVAFKVLFPECASDPHKLERFKREARSASAVNHPNVCAVYDVGEFQGRAYIVMELVEGKTLNWFIDGKPLNFEILLDLGIQISDALTTVHERGIVHSDIRSANIIVNQRRQAKLLDFSAAQAIRERDVGFVKGTSRIRSPISPDCDPSPGAQSRRTAEDIAGIGAILFEMATGRQYKPGSNPSPGLINPAVSDGLDELVQQAITSSPNLHQMADVRDTLLSLKRGLDAKNRSTPIPSGVNLLIFTAHRWAWIGALAAVAAICAIYYMVRPAPPPRILVYKQLTHDGQGKLGAFVAGTPAPLVTDGSRVYFNEVSGSQVIIKEVSASGGDEISLSADLKKPLVAVDISPDRSQLLAADFFQPSPDQQLFTLPLPGGSAHPLGTISGHSGAWSPDGTHICYAQGNRLFVAAADGLGSKMIAELPGVPSWPRWSPDGTRLRVTVQDASGGTSLWEVSLRESQPRPLLPGWNDHPSECCGSWSPDGSYFVFQSVRDGRTRLWALRERHWLAGNSSPAPLRLTEGPLDVWGLAFSTDGRKIFAVVQQRRGELVRYDQASHEFLLYLNGISADQVEFSRDTRWVAFTAYPEQTIWRSRPDGSERLQLTFAPMAAIFARWSPDGQHIAFLGSLPGKQVKIYVVPSSGGNPEPLMPNDDSLEIDPNWSPDGESVMFAKLPSLGANGEDSLIQVFNVKTKQLSTLPGSKGLTAPRWSPDGNHVVATSLSQGKWSHPAVVIFDFNSQRWTGLEEDPIDNKWWSNDGKYFYFDKSMETDPAIYRLRLSDHSIDRIASLKDVRRSLNMMGLWMGLTPNGDPMVLRDTSIEEIYALDWEGR